MYKCMCTDGEREEGNHIGQRLIFGTVCACVCVWGGGHLEHGGKTMFRTVGKRVPSVDIQAQWQ